ncbi:MAG: adenylate kinase [Krumholzibacteria bacterium]|nr:adenylate kinase [Candidatus Krumholzibacteria bacterium]
MNIVIMGPPGVGKGTQAEAIMAERHVAYIATGTILRGAVQEGNELGLQVAALMAAGELVPDHLMMEIIKERLLRPDARDGWLLDGFPRTAPQADGLLALLDGIGQRIDRVLVLDAPDDEIVRRLGGRLTCRACGHVTNLQRVGGPPTACSTCGKDALYTRDDDSEETIRRRLEVFRERTWPAAERLGERSALVRIDGRGTPAEVKQRIAGVL